jgi:DNA-binding FrmR family transcriptional regulator
MRERKNMKKGSCHKDCILALRRVEGQVRGLVRMIEEQRYCVDILNASAAARGALRKVESRMLHTHLNACVRKACDGASAKSKEEKLREIEMLFENLRK